MRLSTRGRYALRAMIDVAQHDTGGPVLRQEIAARQEISADYVAQLFRRLQSAGLVEGVKGPGGGYRLARDASMISARDVVQAVEGRLCVVHCTLPGPHGEPACNRMDRCVTHLLWKRLSESISDMLGSVTLKELAEQGQQLLQEASPEASQVSDVRRLEMQSGEEPPSPLHVAATGQTAEILAADLRLSLQ